MLCSSVDYWLAKLTNLRVQWYRKIRPYHIQSKCTTNILPSQWTIDKLPTTRCLFASMSGKLKIQEGNVRSKELCRSRLPASSACFCRLLFLSDFNWFMLYLCGPQCAAAGRSSSVSLSSIFKFQRQTWNTVFRITNDSGVLSISTDR